MFDVYCVGSEFVNGVPIDRLTEFPEQIRLSVGERMMFLALNELFAWRYMQTDPNWGNFLYDAQRDRICLLDFGACREYSKAFGMFALFPVSDMTT
jgi:aarF domain-containing kinase